MSQQRHHSHGSPSRRDEHTTSRWETLTERLIREAQEQGEFDDLPSHGQPLRAEDETYAGDMAAANRVLRNAGAAPPWIEADKEVRRRLEAIEAVFVLASRSTVVARERLERELDELADAHDEAVTRLEVIAPTARQQRTRLDREVLRERLLSALDLDHHAT